jgi:hypothetical protein
MKTRHSDKRNKQQETLIANSDETDSLYLATNIIGAIKAGFISHVRFFYE